MGANRYLAKALQIQIQQRLVLALDGFTEIFRRAAGTAAPVSLEIGSADSAGKPVVIVVVTGPQVEVDSRQGSQTHPQRHIACFTVVVLPVTVAAGDRQIKTGLNIVYGEIDICCGLARIERTGTGIHLDSRLATGLFGDDIDDTTDCAISITDRVTAAQDFYTFDLRQRDAGQIRPR